MIDFLQKVIFANFIDIFLTFNFNSIKGRNWIGWVTATDIILMRHRRCEQQIWWARFSEWLFLQFFAPYSVLTEENSSLTMVWERFWTNSCSVELFRTLKTVYFTFSSSYMSLPWWPQNWSSVTICPRHRRQKGYFHHKQHTDSSVCMKTQSKTNEMYSLAAIFSYLNLHVEVSFLALFPLLCLHPFLLLQSLHQLLGDVHISHWLEHLTWGNKTGTWLFGNQGSNLENLIQRWCITHSAWTPGCRPTCMRWCNGALTGHRRVRHSCALWLLPWCTSTRHHRQIYTTEDINGTRKRIPRKGRERGNIYNTWLLVNT